MEKSGYWFNRKNIVSCALELKDNDDDDVFIKV